MRKSSLKPIAVLAAVLIPLMAVAGVITHTATYDYSNLTLGTDTLGGVTYTTVNYEGLYNDGAPGMPSLPVDYLKFSVPYNATNFSVTASIGATVINSINHLVYPCQTPRMMNDTTPVTITLPDTSAYYSNTLYPSQRAWVVDEGFLAGENHIVTVAVMPIAYKHASSGMMRNSIRKTSSISLTLSYSISDSTDMRPIVREDSVLRQKGYHMTQSIVVNPAQVSSNAPTASIPIPTLSIQGRGGGIDPFFPPHDSLQVDTTGIGTGGLIFYPKYLIITTQELKPSLRRLAALKRQKGYTVQIVTLDEIINNPLASGGDIIKKADGTTYVSCPEDAGKIRQYLKHAFKWGTEYVLLAGNIPYKIKDNIPTDSYYCELNSDWSGNDYKKGYNLNVGRLLAKTQEQIINYSDKLFRYELYPGKGDFLYLKRIFYSESLDFQIKNEVEYINEKYKSVFTDSTHFKEYFDSQYPSGTDIINRINSTRYGYISFLNHASPSGFISYGYRKKYDNDTVFFYLWSIDSIHYVYDNAIYNLDNHIGNGLNNMTNKWYPSICYSTGCTMTPFDQAPHYTKVTTNFGESFTTGKDYGGPAFLGNTREGYLYKISTELEYNFANLISNNQYNKIGVAEAISKCVNNSTLNKYLFLVHNLIGDPEFEIWTDTPREYSNITVTRSNNSISVSGISGADSTIVAYTDNDGYAQTRVTSSATTFNNVSPNGTIMLYKHNYIPYIAPLFLQNVALSNSQYVIASDVTAGESVDSIRTPGYVTVKSGVEYEIEASGTVTLSDGFSVEKGATFAVYPSSF